MNKIYEYVTENIIKQLEEGTIPWQKPWKDGLPINYITRKPYRGVNLFLLPYGGEYLTFKQIQSLGGKIKKGTKSYMAIFFKIKEYKKDRINSNNIRKEEKENIPILRYYRLFHLSDIEGIPTKIEIEENEHLPIIKAQKILDKWNEEVLIKHEVNSAFYKPLDDIINLPKMEMFKKVEEYYSIAFHEIAHSTGHENRLARFLSTDSIKFGNDIYSFEELVAELGSSMMCGVVGIEETTINNSASYIAGWLKKLRNDKSLIIKASSKAQKSCDYVLNQQAKEFKQELEGYKEVADNKYKEYIEEEDEEIEM